jgi:hypothetical protein
VGPCEIKTLPPDSKEIKSINPLFIPPLANSHELLLQQLLVSKKTIVFNTSGAGKTKLAYSISLMSSKALVLLLLNQCVLIFYHRDLPL